MTYKDNKKINKNMTDIDIKNVRRKHASEIGMKLPTDRNISAKDFENNCR